MDDLKRDRIENAIRHIQTATDVDPWAAELAVEALKAQLLEEDTTPDCISRQAAIDALQHIDISIIPYKKAREYADATISEIRNRLKKLPSVQPDIIHCEDCAKCQIDNIYHDYWCNGKKVWKMHYCGYAERRTNGSD